MTHAVLWEGEITFGGRNGNRKDQVGEGGMDEEGTGIGGRCLERNTWKPTIAETSQNP